MSRSTFFISVEIFKIEIFQSRLFSRDFDASRFLSRLSRRVKIVEICRDASRFSRFVEMQSRFVETLSRFVEKSQHCRGLLSLKILKSLDGLRNLNIVEAFWVWKFWKVLMDWEISTLSRPFESENDEKSWRIEKSRQENTKIHALLDQDRDNLSRNAKIFRSQWNSWSR
jgi:hypothetical protein